MPLLEPNYHRTQINKEMMSMIKNNLKIKKTVALIVAMTLIVGLFSVSIYASNSKVDKLLSSMTLREKIEQMLMMEIREWDGEDFTKMNDEVEKIISEYNFGAVILFANNIKKTKATFKLTQAMQKAAISDGGIPMIIATDQEGGIVYRLGSGTALPGNMALAASGKTSNSLEAGKVIGSELSVLGINTSLAPVVDINNNPNNTVIGLRSYGDNATIVGNHAAEMIKGMSKYNVVACAKHFPGHGDTATDSHYGLPIVKKTKAQLMKNELKPYKIAIKKGADMVMTAHILYPKVERDKVKSTKTGKKESLPATMSDKLIKEILKGEFGFKGIVCTDGMHMQGITDYWNESQAAINAIKAGTDMLCMPVTLRSTDDIDNLDKFIDKIISAVKKGKISRKRIDDACSRILRVKQQREILDYNAEDYSLEKAESVVGCKENREIEKRLADEAVTLIRNKGKTVPLKTGADSKVLMMVPYSNEDGQMVMAWNRAKESGIVPKGAKVKTVCYNGIGDVESLKDKIDWADTIILNSEISSGLRVAQKSWLYLGPQSFIKYAKLHNKKTVVISVDVPYDVTLYTKADAVLAVYGCKGSSVDPTEALEKNTTHINDACGPNIVAGVEAALGAFKPMGKLPVNVPTINKSTGKYNGKIKYKRGYCVK